ncbi:MAG: 30S ribosomal protein S4e [Candidatus Bathyarchaeota archaeon]|jgi:small subunit ribosomal protein S4e
MGKKGGSQSLKRKPAPSFWPISRKEFVWTIRPSSGPHSLRNCIPLTVVLRDILKFAKTRKEAVNIINKGKVYVDGRVRKEDDFPIGLMDVVHFSDTELFFRLLPFKKGLTLHPITKRELNFKLCRIENKRIIKNGQLQLNLHDGSNIIIKIDDLKNPKEDVYNTFNSLKISLPEKQIMQQIKLKEKVYTIITSGKNIGKHGRIIEIEKAEGKKRRNTLVTIEDKNEVQYQTILNYLFAVGDEEPEISLPGVD